MDSTTHPLKTLLQLHLATDISAATHLSTVLVVLNEECFSPSPHLTKWTARIHSLLHSKESCGRWAGLCLAYQTSQYSKEILVEYAQGWLSVALPLLSKNESVPVLKAAMRLMYKIFSGGMDTPEFQRQVCVPSVLKMTIAAVALAEKHGDIDFKAFVLDILAKIVYLYPNLHRASHQTLSSLALSYLDGSTPGPTDATILNMASELYVALHFTGGKVGAANYWRKSIEETLNFGWNAFLSLRTTFPVEVQNIPVPPRSSGDDPLITVPLNLDRLRCCVSVLGDLFRTPSPRPVLLPLGSLSKFCSALLTCSDNNQIEGHVDASVRMMEVMVVPEIWKSGCQILSQLATCVGHHLTSHRTRLVACLAIHLERKPKDTLRLRCLEALKALMMHCHPLDCDLIPNRLTKAVLPLLTPILAESPDASKGGSQKSVKRKGKQRGRAFEGDEILKSSKEAICKTPEDEESLILALEVLRYLLRSPNLSSQMQSLSSRVLVSIYLSLPGLPRAFLAPTPSFQARISDKIRDVITDAVTGSSSVASRSLGLVVACSDNGTEMHRCIDLLLHPRVPPLIRREPLVQALSLTYDEESQEEASLRTDLNLVIPGNNAQRLPELSKQAIQAKPSDLHQHQHQTVGNPDVTILSSKPTITTQPYVSTAQNQAILQSSEPPTSHVGHRAEALMTPKPKDISQKQIVSTLLSQPQMHLPDEDEEMPTIDMASDTDDSD
ncbi:hypothetical protein M378DRAFT_96610, partial [Amanita muscaria Koide BX008]